MKKILSLLALKVLTVLGIYGQSPAPGIFNYQGVARNSVGNVLVNKTITLRLTIRDNIAAGPLVYQESRTVTTNPFGLFNVQVGSPGATNVTGSIPVIAWGVNNKFIQVEIDPNGGTSFINIGTAQIASVPYALYSSIANDLVLPFNKTQADNGSLFRIVNSGTATGSTALEGVTNSNAGNAAAILGIVNNAAAGGFSAGVRGINNSTTGNGIGVYGSQGGSGWGVYGTTPSGRGVFGQSNTGVGLYGSTSTGRALRTDGAVQFTGIGEGAPVAPNTFKIMAGDPAGNGTWEHASAIGLVSGSGTLNFVPKWTPNGTTLGNSLIFDNGTNVGIGTTTPTARFSVNELFKVTSTGTVIFANSVNPLINMLESGTANPDKMVLQHSPAFPTWGLQYQDAPDKFNFLGNGTPVLTVDLGTQNVGVNQVAPVNTNKLHVNGTGTAGAITQRTSIFAGGNLDGANGHGLIADGEWRAVWGRNLGTGGRFEATGVRGETGGSNYTNGAGVLGTSTGTGNNIGVSGLASGSAALNFGLRGQASAATPGQNWGVFGLTSTLGGQNVAVAGQAPIAANSWAGAFFGRVNITDGTQALNRIFTSDAFGNGSWQPLGAIGGVGGSGTLNFVAKWTPDGFTIGNSQIFDNGTRVNVGTNFGDPNSLTINNTGASGGNATVSLQGASGFGNASGIVLEQATNRTHLTVGSYDADAGTAVMTWDGANQNVGIGTTAPARRLHAVSTINSFGTQDFFLDNNSGSGTSWAQLALRSTGAGARLQGLTFIGTANANSTIFFNEGGLFTNHLVLSTNSSGNTPDISINKANTNVGIGRVNAQGRLHVASGNTINYAVPSLAPTTSATVSEQTVVTGNEVAGITAYGDGSSLENEGIIAAAGGSSGFNIGGIFLAQTASAGTNVGVFGRAQSGANNYAGFFQGSVLISDGTQGVGRVFTDNGAGSGIGEWRDPSAAGLVSGSGTTNFVPRWTPNGNTLGNSTIQDNGSATAVSAGVDNDNTLSIGQAVTSPEPTLFYRGTIDAAGIYLENSTGRLHLTVNNDAATGNKGLTIEDNAPTSDLTAVGIGIAAPNAKLNVLSDYTGTYAVPSVAAVANGAVVQQNAATGGNAGIQAYADGASGEQYGVFGVAGGSSSANVGGLFLSQTASGGTNYGIYSRATGGASNYAGFFQGRVAVADGTQGNGYVFTSDAFGNGSWQDLITPNVGIALRTTNPFALSIPNGVVTPITQWNTIVHENGGANYDNTTGEYIITVAGVYQVNASTPFQPTAAGFITVQTYVNGLFDNENVHACFAGQYLTPQLSYNRQFAVGDRINVRVFQLTGAAQNLIGNFFATNFSVQLIHK